MRGSEEKRLVNRFDIAAIALVLLLGLAGLFFTLRPKQAERLMLKVTAAGETLGEYDLSRLPAEGRTEVFTANGCTLTVLLERDGVRVLESDCPHGDCVKTGRIASRGQSIVCLPARLVFSLSGGDAAGAPDITVG